MIGSVLQESTSPTHGVIAFAWLPESRRQESTFFHYAFELGVLQILPMDFLLVV